MGHHDWKKIWGNKANNFQGEMTLETLLTLNGYDTNTGRVTVEEWRRYVHCIADKMGMTAGHSVYEVGCGSGAFLHVLHEIGCEVGGIDYSTGLATIAGQVIPGARVEAGDALSTATTPLYDFVVSAAVFLYFPNLEYVGQVLSIMLAKAQRGVAVLDVNDLALKDRAIAARKAAYPEGEYEARYAGLDQLYLPAGWFAEYGGRLGHRVVVEPQVLSCPNSDYRYNVLIFKSWYEEPSSSPPEKGPGSGP